MTQLCTGKAKVAVHNEWLWLCSSKTLFVTLKYEFHIIFTVVKYCSFIFFPQPFKNVQNILSSWAVQK